MTRKAKFINEIDRVTAIAPGEREKLAEVCKTFTFLATDYYLSLVDWNDPADPLRKIVFPDPQELQQWGKLDASNEHSYTVLPGLQHKYDSTALLLLSNKCAGQCRYCFRKRIFIKAEDQTVADIDQAMSYIREHEEISNVLITGGDPLMISTSRLRETVARLRDIEHVQIVRIGSKTPAYNPHRILEDPELADIFRKYSTGDKRMYLVCHFNHARELTPDAVRAVTMLREAGAIVVNQTPMIAGVNDRPEPLADLFAACSFYGITPYYVFQCRPAVGNRGYAVPVERGYDVFEEARSRVSGLAKRARYVMSHESGKIEIVGRVPGWTFFKYHRSARQANDHRFIICRSNPEAYWFDDFEEVDAFPADQADREELFQLTSA